MDQKRIRHNDRRQEAVKLGYRVHHPKRAVESGNIRHGHRKATDTSGQGDDGERGPRLDERYFSRSKEMDDEELLRHNSISESLWGYLFSGWGNLTCVRAPSRNHAVWARAMSGEPLSRIPYRNLFQYQGLALAIGQKNLSNVPVKKKSANVKHARRWTQEYHEACDRPGIPSLWCGKILRVNIVPV
jgi:hypothetical protein